MKEELLLTVLHAFKGERTIYGALHILQGTKSAQAIQDCHFFSLFSYYHLFPKITRAEVESLVKRLEEKGLLNVTEDDRAQLTNKGINHTLQFLQRHPFLKQLNGWKYLRLTESFWLRLTLLIQTFTHLKVGHTQFIPLTSNKEIQVWVKNQVRNQHEQVDLFLENVYSDIAAFLHTCTEKQAQTFVMQLSSPVQIGLTLFQTAAKLNLESDHITILHKATLHKLFDALHEGAFPALYPCIDGIEKQYFTTETAAKTAQLIKQGLTIEQVVRKRELKRSTIEDHLVELALYDSAFSIKPYLTADDYHTIVKASKNLDTFKLKQLRTHLGDQFSYFKIRLALTRKDSSYGPS